MRARAMRQERSCQMSRGTASADEQIEAGRAERLLERGFKAVRLRTTSCAGMCSRLSIEALELPARDHAGAVWRQIPAPLSWVEAGLSRAAFFDSPTKCPAVPSGGDWVALATVLMSDVPAFALEPAKTDPAHQSDERW